MASVSWDILFVCFQVHGQESSLSSNSVSHQIKIVWQCCWSYCYQWEYEQVNRLLLLLCTLTLVLVRYSIYRSIAILAKVRYQFLVVSRYFDIFCIERPLFDTFDTLMPSILSIPMIHLIPSIPSILSIPLIPSIPSIFRYLTSSPFDDVDAKPKAQATSLLMTTLFTVQRFAA